MVSRRRAKGVLAALLAIAGLAVAVPAAAAWLATASNAGNVLAADTLEPPSSLVASGACGEVALDWTPTGDSYASGHRVLRSTSPGGPYTEIAELTPRTQASYSEAPATGTYYYVTTAFVGNWESVASNEAAATVDGGSGSTGLLSPTSQAPDTGGNGDGFEVSPESALTDGLGNAANLAGTDDRHRFYNFGISVPTGCVVTGIEVRLDWWLGATQQTNSMSAELSWDGGSSWTAAKFDTTETTAEHTIILGGPADTWGRTWTPGEVSDANFQLRLTSRCSGAAVQCSKRNYFLDWAAVRVSFGGGS